MLKLIAVALAVFPLAAFAEAVPTPLMTFCHAPGSHAEMEAILGAFSVEVVESDDTNPYKILRLNGEKVRALAAALPDGRVCVFWTAKAETPA